MPKCATAAGLTSRLCRSSWSWVRWWVPSSMGPTRPSPTPRAIPVQYTNRRQCSKGGCDRAMDAPSPSTGRKISIVRLLTKCACGCVLGLARRSHTRWSTPNRDSSAERVSPTGPAPTMSTGTATSAGRTSSSSSSSGYTADDGKVRTSLAHDWGTARRVGGASGARAVPPPGIARPEPSTPRAPAPQTVRKRPRVTALVITSLSRQAKIKSRARTRTLCSTSSCSPTAPSCSRPSPCPSSSCWRCASRRRCAA